MYSESLNKIITAYGKINESRIQEAEDDSFADSLFNGDIPISFVVNSSYSNGFDDTGVCTDNCTKSIMLMTSAKRKLRNNQDMEIKEEQMESLIDSLFDYGRNETSKELAQLVIELTTEDYSKSWFEKICVILNFLENVDDYTFSFCGRPEDDGESYTAIYRKNEIDDNTLERCTKLFLDSME